MTPQQIGAAVRKARGQRSIREVAGAAGLSRHQVTSIEQGTTAYTINSLLALCNVVGLRLRFIEQGWLREALLKLVELEDRTLEGMSSGAPTAEEWRKAFDEARYVIDITRP